MRAWRLLVPVLAFGCASDRADVGARGSWTATTEHASGAQNADTQARESEAFDPELSRYAYPLAVSEFEIESPYERLRMAYMDVRPRDPNGRSVVLLHGKSFASDYWEPTIRALVERGFRVVVPDQIGFGKSSKPRAYAFRLHALADNTHALLARLQIDRAVIVGHSMGGMLATRFALMFPEATERLVLVCPLGLEDYRIGDAVSHRRRVVRARARGDARELARVSANELLRRRVEAGVRAVHPRAIRMDAPPGLSARRMELGAHVRHDLHAARRVRAATACDAGSLDRRRARSHRDRQGLRAAGSGREAKSTS